MKKYRFLYTWVVEVEAEALEEAEKLTENVWNKIDINPPDEIEVEEIDVK
jgi:hypothetical protein